MNRSIIGFRFDDDGDWIALLDCGHSQHVRHRPPLSDRPWVITEEGRASRIGQKLDCVLCDRPELPSHFVPYSRTPLFTDESIPPGLRRDHPTKAGVWARIVVTEGRLRYHVEPLERVFDLYPEVVGIVAPGAPHHVEPLGTVTFYVEFYRSPDVEA